MNEIDKLYEIEPLTQDFNEYMQLKSYGYQTMLTRIGEMHLNQTDQGIGHVIGGHYAWVLMSMTIEIDTPIETVGKRNGKTYYAGRKGPYYRREYLIEDKAGNSIIKASSFSILMDLDDRSIYRKRELPFSIFNAHEVYQTNASPQFKDDVKGKLMGERTVLNSHVDALGHVNNLRYHEFIYDALSTEEVKKLKNIKKIEAYYHKELMLGETFKIYKDVKKNKIIFQLKQKEDDALSHTLVYTFRG